MKNKKVLLACGIVLIIIGSFRIIDYRQVLRKEKREIPAVISLPEMIDVKIVEINGASDTLLEYKKIRFWWKGKLGNSDEKIKLPKEMVQQRINETYQQ